MAYGACDTCGCAFHECECADRAKTEKKTGRVQVMHVRLIPGDWVRVKRGHRLEGAAGAVRSVNRGNKPALVTFRQLNGNELRIPLGLLEFVGYRGEEPDVL